MDRRGQAGNGRGLLALVLALFAVLLQVNAPVARAAAMADPLQGPICQDSPSGSRQGEPRAPSDHDRGCAACVVCCAAPAAVLARGAAVRPRLSPAVRIVHRPEVSSRPVRGPPAFRARARAPPAVFA